MHLSALVRSDCSLRGVDDGVVSTLSEGASPGSYDDRARFYDVIVGSAFYNRLLWGARTDSYRAFVRRALTRGTGPFLDAGSGSAVFTAAAYATSERPIVLADRSIGMLRAARQRIAAEAEGSLPDRMALVQADLFDLPFRSGAFGTVLSMGMMHLFENATDLVRALLDTVAARGRLYLTSLVAERAVGRWYLAALHRAGEVARPRSFAEAQAVVEAASEAGDVEAWREGSMAYFVVPAGR